MNRKAWAAQRRYVARLVEGGAPCAICGRPIDLGEQWAMVGGRRVRSPWSLEVDHVTPISQGGAVESLENVQPAHRICNQRKGGAPRSAARVVGSSSVDW